MMTLVVRAAAGGEADAGDVLGRATLAFAAVGAVAGFLNPPWASQCWLLPSRARGPTR